MTRAFKFILMLFPLKRMYSCKSNLRTVKSDGIVSNHFVQGHLCLKQGHMVFSSPAHANVRPSYEDFLNSFAMKVCAGPYGSFDYISSPFGAQPLKLSLANNPTS